MTDSPFRSFELTLKELLKAAEEGALQLPEFQRSWVWDDARIRSLIASVSRAFPVGAIMTLKTGGDVRLAARPVEGVSVDREPDTLLLDGQQRITSLYQTTLRGEVVHTRNSKGQKRDYWYYIDMARALDDPSDREDAIVAVPGDRVVRENIGRDVVLDLSTPEREFEALMFPLARVFDASDWRFDYNEFWREDPDFKQRAMFFDRFEREVLRAFQAYKLPVIELSASTSREAVCAVFEKVNTGGKPLDAFELVTAAFAVDGFNLRDDWDARREAMRRAEGIGDLLSNVSSTDFLQVVALLDGLNRRASDPDERLSATRAALLRMEAATYRRWADAARDGLIAAAKFLRQLGVIHARDLPYQTQVVPLATIIAVVGRDWERESVRERVAQWYWCGVFGEQYGAAVESRFVLDATDVPTWARDPSAPVPATVRDADIRPERLDQLRTRGSAAYKGINALLLRVGARDWRSGQAYRDTVVFEEKVDIHHVFPVRWCEQNGIEPKIYNSILNKTPLSASANGRLGGAAPSDYLRKMKEWAHGDPDELVRSHLIQPTVLHEDDFESHLAKRRDALLTEINQRMGRNGEAVSP